MINVIKTALDGVVIIEPKVFGDARGYRPSKSPCLGRLSNL